MSRHLRHPLAISGIYALCGALWIYFSDRFIAGLPLDPQALAWTQTYKGWGYITVTAVLVYLLTRYAFRTQALLTRHLRERERALATLLANLPGMAYRCRNDPEWTMEFVSEGCQALCGYTAQELLGNRVVAWGSLIHSDDREPVWTQVQEALAEKRPFRLAYRIVDRAGTVHWLWEQGAGVFEDGELRALEGFIADITERQHAEEELRETHDRLTALINASPLAIIHTDIKGKVQLWNQAAQRMFGWSADEVIGKPPPFVPEESQEEFHALRGRVVCGESLSGLHLRRKHTNGELIDISLSSAPTYDASGRIDGIMAVIENIGDKLRAVTAISTLNAELEQRLAERTARLGVLDKELEAFTYSVAHDLKAPLRGIDGYGRLLEEECSAALSPECGEFVANIRRGALQMNDLIEDLLAYSRMERRPFQRTEFDLRHLVQNALLEYRQQIEQRDVQVEIDIPELAVHTDRDGLLLALRNLIANALQFSRDAHPPRLEIGVRTDGETCQLWVKDNGIGFDMRFHDRVFQIFQRLQRSEEYGGTGIGLALVHKVMQRMGGRCWAQSAPGAGATFYLEIPNES